MIVTVLFKTGVFGATVGAVSEAQIKQYIEDQSDDPNTLKVWDEPELADQGVESDSTENSHDFQSQ